MALYSRIVGVLVLTGCLGPEPQAADDDSGGGGATAPTDGGGGTTNSGGGGGATSDGGTSSSGGGGSPPVEPTLGGELHFLQAGSVTLANGAATTVVSANGPFTFPGLLSENEAYDVTVTSSPTGQTCWVQNGSGIAQGAVTDIDVRCSTVLRSQTPNAASQVSTTSSSYQPIPNLEPIEFTTDVEADVLATILVPKVFAGSNGVFRIGLQLDGTTIGEANYQAWEPVPTLSVPITGVSAGEHTLVAVWSVTAGNLTQYSDVYRSEMSLTVLQSLPSFDRKLTTALASDGGSLSLANNQVTPTAMGFTPLAIDVPGAAQPTLVSLLANDMKGDRFASRFAIDGQGLAGSLMSYDINGQLVRSFAPLALTTLATGTHSVDAQWFRTDVNAIAGASRGTNAIGSTLSAVLFKPGTASAVDTLEGQYSMNPLPAAFALVNSSLQTSIDLPKASSVLVTLHAPNMRVIPTWPASADVAIFVNGTQGPTVHPYNANDIDWGCQGVSAAGIVSVPAGNTTIEVRARQGSDTSGTNQLQLGNMGLSGANRTILSAIVLD